AEFCRDETISIADCIVYDHETDLHYMLVRERPRDPSTVIGSKRFAAAMDLVKEEFEFIVLDAAPVLAVTETRLLLQHADQVAFCIRWGYTDVETVDEALQSIESTDTDTPLVGVLTRVDMKKGASYGLSSSKHHKAFKKYYQYQTDD
ncbi:MAG: tyrosine-protein kinase family protein, partial [Geminicoccaceae bacterium]